MNEKLAILGGEPIRKGGFSKVSNVSKEERAAVQGVLDSGNLSGFMGTWSDGFYGGPMVQECERLFKAHFNVKHAISVNSASSGLQAAIAASGVGPGDEVIVTPYSMAISATCPFAVGAIPVFADVDPKTFCITSETIKKVLTSKTKAIVVVQLFGNTTDMDEIMDLASEHDLIVIEDAAQAPDGLYKNLKTGTIGHMGVFSLNVHKVISSGEGGVVVTNNDDLAERLTLVRNHGEIVVASKKVKNLVNMVGYNFRMCELEAAIAKEQIKKLSKLTQPRIEAAEYLSEKLKDFPGIIPPYKLEGVKHVYYNYGLLFNQDETKIPRSIFVKALQAEGIPFVGGYMLPLYLMPVFQQKIVFGDKGFPYTCKCYGEVKGDYNKGSCPDVEQLEEVSLIQTNHICRAGVTNEELQDVVKAFEKVFLNQKNLLESEVSV